MGNKSPPFSESGTDEEKRVTGEEAENAEVIFGKPLRSFGLLTSVGNGAVFSLASWALSLFPVLSLYY